MHTSLIDAITLNRQNVEIYTRAYHPCRLLPHRIEDDAFQTPHKLCVPSGSVRFPPEACVLLIQREGINSESLYCACITTLILHITKVKHGNWNGFGTWNISPGAMSDKHLCQGNARNPCNINDFGRLNSISLLINLQVSSFTNVSFVICYKWYQLSWYWN